VSPDSVVVLGASNTGVSIAAKLALEGKRVVLWEAPAFEEALAPIAAHNEVRITGTAGEGVARLAATTTNPEEALAAGDVLIAAVPSYAHTAFADLLVPHLESRHILALLPGNLGTLEFAARLRAEGKSTGDPLLVEADTAPYVCRKLAPDHAHIWGVVTQLGIGALPGSAADAAEDALRPLFPGLKPYPDVLWAGLSALNPVVHPPGVLMNAARIEEAGDTFRFYNDGLSPAVATMVEALDGERLAVGRALGLSLLPVAEGFATCGFGPAGDLWATINGSRMLTQLRAPGSLETRWLSEDIPFGIRTWAELGESLGLEMPVARSLVTLGDVLIGEDSWISGRSLADLGIAGLRSDELRIYAETGESPNGRIPGESTGVA
jgi:opine dehydrogenase